jgi:DNA-binding response OmpR family regulator
MARIVIADVEKNLASVLKCELELEGHSVAVEHQGTANSSAGERRTCDAVLLDMQTFSLNFRKYLKQIKLNNPAARILIYMNSPATDARAGLIEAGAEDCFGEHEIERLKEYLRSLTDFPAPSPG